MTSLSKFNNSDERVSREECLNSAHVIVHSTINKIIKKMRKINKERKDKNYHRRDWNLIKVALLSSFSETIPCDTRGKHVFAKFF